jgi:hypothetical protein
VQFVERKTANRLRTRSSVTISATPRSTTIIRAVPQTDRRRIRQRDSHDVLHDFCGGRLCVIR